MTCHHGNSWRDRLSKCLIPCWSPEVEAQEAVSSRLDVDNTDGAEERSREEFSQEKDAIQRSSYRTSKWLPEQISFRFHWPSVSGYEKFSTMNKVKTSKNISAQFCLSTVKAGDVGLCFTETSKELLCWTSGCTSELNKTSVYYPRISGGIVYRNYKKIVLRHLWDFNEGLLKSIPPCREGHNWKTLCCKMII